MFNWFKKKQATSSKEEIEKHARGADDYFHLIVTKNIIDESPNLISIDFPIFSKDSNPIKEQNKAEVDDGLRHQAREVQKAVKLKKLVNDFDRNKKNNLTFSEKLVLFAQEKDMPYSLIYKAANLDRRHFSKIISNKNYSPSRDTALALTIALRLSLPEAKEFLSLAGFALSHKNRRDIIIEYFIREKQYNLILINETLFALKEKIIGK